MADIHRRSIPIEACTTLFDAGIELGGSRGLLQNHRNAQGFPKMVAQFGPTKLYVFAELEAFYNSVLWRQADKQIKELTGGDAA